MARKRFVREADFETEASEPAVMAAIAITKSNRNERGYTFLEGPLYIPEDSFICGLLQRKRVQFVTKLVILVCQD